jgi:hypothetical protein
MTSYRNARQTCTTLCLIKEIESKCAFIFGGSGDLGRSEENFHRAANKLQNVPNNISKQNGSNVCQRRAPPHRNMIFEQVNHFNSI